MVLVPLFPFPGFCLLDCGSLHLFQAGKAIEEGLHRVGWMPPPPAVLSHSNVSPSRWNRARWSMERFDSSLPAIQARSRVLFRRPHSEISTTKFRPLRSLGKPLLGRLKYSLVATVGGLLAGQAEWRPWHGGQTLVADFLFTVQARSESTVLDTA